MPMRAAETVNWVAEVDESNANAMAGKAGTNRFVANGVIMVSAPNTR
jgi:hypothetical protein